MAERICSIENCDRPVQARGWCWSHYKKWRKYGDPEHQERVRLSGLCAVDDCDRPNQVKGWCIMHYQRLRRHGDTTKLRSGEPFITAYGYLAKWDPQHQLSRNSGYYYVHRAMLWESLGEPRKSPCHWCGRTVDWFAEDRVDQACTDHLDHDRLNNDLQNLVVSCHACNSARRFPRSLPYKTK